MRAGAPACRIDALVRAHPTRLAPAHRAVDEITRRHAEAVRDRRPTYVDPVSGYAVFTAAFLAQRGWCCESGCRHCPFVGA
jgi:hypothetical protein